MGTIKDRNGMDLTEAEIVRRAGSLEKTLMLGKTEGRRRRDKREQDSG